MNPLSPESQTLVDTTLAALDDLKAKDVLSLDVRSLTSLADVMIIASGTSTRHVKSLADNVVKMVKEAGMKPIGMEGERDGDWVLIDLGGVIVHVMQPATRAFYDLERLWTPGASGHITQAKA
ncbi:MAG: ribosome silencing factor [Moraxellaceae bacterium]|jgi:ribosome-associated protein|nr:ribosome silencing factor [Moraxellaceae bacterium]HCT39956.1 ribosome silencing factor [Moraxellaceae bacterium]